MKCRNIQNKNLSPVGVIVIGGHVQGLGIIRVFGKRGIPCILIDDTRINIARHSKYCSAFYLYKKNKLIEFLKLFAKKIEYKNWLLLPTNDYHVKVLSQERERLERDYNVTITNWEVIENCYNKKLTYKIAEKVGIPYPKTWIPKSKDDLRDKTIPYPCIIKPAVMHSFYAHFKTKVFICKNYEELLSNYQKALTHINQDEVIIQEIIPGHERAQYSACFLFNVDHALVQVAVCRLRQHPIDFGNATTFAETIDNDVIINYGTQLLKEIKFRGICEIEFKKDPRDGVFKLLEINPRSWKWHYIAEVSESPFLWGLYNYCLNKRLNKVYLNWSKACWQHQLTDSMIIIKLLLKRIRVKPIKCNNKIYAVFDKRDLKPYIFEKLYLPYLLITR